MNEQTWTFLDRATWGNGPWDSEPDKVQWTDDATRLPCLAVRNSMGAWCGYVAVTEGHPFFGKPYDDCPVDAHGGLTYSDFCQEGDGPHRICHIPEPGQPDHVWWLGFDTAHSGDLVPSMRWTHRTHETYRSLSYVQAECAALAAQIAAPVTL